MKIQKWQESSSPKTTADACANKTRLDSHCNRQEKWSRSTVRWEKSFSLLYERNNSKEVRRTGKRDLGKRCPCVGGAVRKDKTRATSRRMKECVDLWTILANSPFTIFANPAWIDHFNSVNDKICDAENVSSLQSQRLETWDQGSAQVILLLKTIRDQLHLVPSRFWQLSAILAGPWL